MSVYQNNEIKEEDTSRTLSLVVDNQPGTLARVIGLFSGRGYNIESLTVTEIDNARNLSRISLVTREILDKFRVLSISVTVRLSIL